MVPHKTARGKDALSKLKCFEGIPAPYDKVKRVVVPSALRTLKLKPRRDVIIPLLPSPIPPQLKFNSFFFNFSTASSAVFLTRSAGSTRT